MIRLLGLFGLSLLIACSSNEESSHGFQVYEEDGVTIAETSGGPKYTRNLFYFEEMLTLIEDSENEDSFLFNPGLFLMDSEGYFYISDYGNHRIAVFDPQGNYNRSIGQQGEGPGDFQSPSIQNIHDNTLSIFDSRLIRTSLFHTNGTLQNIFSSPERYPGINDYIVTEDGSFLTISIKLAVDGSFVLNSKSVVLSNAVEDSLWCIETPQVLVRYQYRYANGSGMTSVEYTGRPVIQYFPKKGILESTGMVPRVRWYNLAGELVGEYRLAIEKEQVSEAERTAIIQRADEDIIIARENNRRIDRAEARREALYIPDHKAFWSDAYIDDAGYLWLSIPEPIEDIYPHSGFRQRVISPDGEYLGGAQWPGFQVSICNGRLLTYIIDEESGATIPTVYRIIPAVEGLKYP